MQLEEKDMSVAKNAPCPCGSGKKYKRCCMLKEELEPQQEKKPQIEILRDLPTTYSNDYESGEYEFDDEGNNVKWTSFNSDGSIWSWGENEYDASGNMISTVEFNADGSIAHQWP